MSTLTLVRHAQASLFADDYDQLSDVGRQQARLLGEFWACRGTDFDEVYCGPRARQRQTPSTFRARDSSSVGPRSPRRLPRRPACTLDGTPP